MREVAERFDRELPDLFRFRLQDEITQLFLVALHVKLTIGADALNLWQDLGKDPEVYRPMVEGRNYIQTFGREGHRKGEKLTNEAFKNAATERIGQPVDGLAALATASVKYHQGPEFRHRHGARFRENGGAKPGHGSARMDRQRAE